MKYLLAILVCVICLHVEASSPIVSAYYENSSQYRPPSGNRKVFAPSMIDAELLTDIYYAFAYFGFINKSIDPNNPRLTGDYSIQPTDANDIKMLYPQIQALKQTSKGLKIWISIGGWNFNDPKDPQGAGQYTYRLFSQMVSQPSSRKQFIDSAIDYAHKYGFDGIDFDWEYPGDQLRGGTLDDFGNFVQFLKECSEAFHNATPSILVSYTAPPFVPFGLPRSYIEDPNSYYKWISQCAQHLDRINLMGYDYHGPFDDPKLTGANSPLNRDTNPSSTHYIARSVEFYLSNGVPASKIVLGLPVFGHSYAGVNGLTTESNGPGKVFSSAGAPGPSTRAPGTLAYYEIADMMAQRQLLFGADAVTSTAYGYNITGGSWVSFDTPDTMALKVALAKNKQLGGVMFWTIDMDEYEWQPRYPNIRSASSLLKSGF